jgi:hypothetical protein
MKRYIEITYTRHSGASTAETGKIIACNSFYVKIEFERPQSAFDWSPFLSMRWRFAGNLGPKVRHSAF